MLAAKNSRKRMPARSPAAATSAGGEGEVIGTSWFMASDHRPELSQGDEFHAKGRGEPGSIVWIQNRRLTADTFAFVLRAEKIDPITNMRGNAVGVRPFRYGLLYSLPLAIVLRAAQSREPPLADYTT
jgi:hypothetical protein